MRPVTSITIIYDASCGLCTRLKDWIGRQLPLVSIQFAAAGSAEARRKFSNLPPGELAVVADTGEVWLGNHAWIVCLWAFARLSQPRCQVDQAASVASGPRGVHGRVQEPFRAL